MQTTLEILNHPLLSDVRHGFFTRKGGASSGLFAGLNCGRRSSDQADMVRVNRGRVAQAMGVPAVVQDLGSVVERVIDGETGTIARDDDSFAEAAVHLLTDDELWRVQHKLALDAQRKWGWAQAAEAFERLIP